jgi:hypothetical protein
MKKIALLLLIFITFIGKGQNLVQNPSFEKFTLCPDNFSSGAPDELSYSIGWCSFGQTPDYYNTCSANSQIKPPNCFLGFQYPHTGNAYAGFVSYYTQSGNYRELIGGNLLSTLVTGQKYFISFYVNFSGQNQITIASNKIGVKFSTVPYSYSNPAPINNFAHFYSNDIITDTINWTMIRGSFIADSAYSYIIIGNFFTDSLTDTILLSPGIAAYYYIDDVCLSTDSLYCADWLGVNENSANNKEAISIYPNPATEFITLESERLMNGKLYIINNLGLVVKEEEVKQTNEKTLSIRNLPAGLYLLKYNSNIMRFSIVK